MPPGCCASKIPCFLRRQGLTVVQTRPPAPFKPDINATSDLAIFSCPFSRLPTPSIPPEEFCAHVLHDVPALCRRDHAMLIPSAPSRPLPLGVQRDSRHDEPSTLRPGHAPHHEDQPNLAIPTRKCAATRGGRVWKANPLQAGCVHLRLRGKRPQSFMTIKQDLQTWWARPHVAEAVYTRLILALIDLFPTRWQPRVNVRPHASSRSTNHAPCIHATSVEKRPYHT